MTLVKQQKDFCLEYLLYSSQVDSVLKITICAQ